MWKVPILLFTLLLLSSLPEQYLATSVKEIIANNPPYTNIEKTPGSQKSSIVTNNPHKFRIKLDYTCKAIPTYPR